MALSNQVTKLKTYKEYLHEIGTIPTYQLDKAFACGLPAVWLYLKAIGLEEVYFEILEKIKNRALLFKELFYLLILTNNNNKFFPHVPEDFLNIELPPAIAAAQVEIREPEFALGYSFKRDQLLDTLRLIAKPNVMIRLGDEKRSIGLIYSNNAYHVYHADNPRALEFKDLEGCVDLIIRVMKNG